jgi:histidyl-tRNA synthetase
LLGEGRKDESGDFTKGAGLEAEHIKLVVEFVRAQKFLPLEDVTTKTGMDERGKPMQFAHAHDGMPGGTFRLNNDVTIENLRKKFGLNDTANVGIEELEQIGALCRAAGYKEDRILIDPSVVRGLEYYTGPVYEIELLTKDEKGRPVRFGSVGGGGRYDGLVSRFRGEPVPATGFSIGVSRLQAALKLLGKLDSKPAPGPVLVTVFDRDRVADYQKMVARLRDEKIRAELYLGNQKHSIGQQLKYADKRGSPCAVIQGPDEKAKGEVQIKDLILGGALSAIKDRDEYLRKQAEAQFAVPEDKLVEAVRELLARHKIEWN